MPGTVNYQALLFDVYGTLIDIKTDEHRAASWQTVAAFLGYQGLDLKPEQLRRRYFQQVRAFLDASPERCPDVDVIDIFAELLAEAGWRSARTLARTVAPLFRSLTIDRLALFPETKAVLSTLAQRFRLGLVTDAQEPYLMPELRLVGLDGGFETVIMSSRYGYRKPDPRLFRHALRRLALRPQEALYIGDSWERDVVGANAAGMDAVWVQRAAAPPPAAAVPVISDLGGLLDPELLGHG